jgi:hypothetical protein
VKSWESTSKVFNKTSGEDGDGYRPTDLATGEIAGVVVGVIMALAFISMAAFWFGGGIAVKHLNQQ